MRRTYGELRTTFYGPSHEPAPAPEKAARSDEVLAEFRERVAPYVFNSQHPGSYSYFTPPPLPMSVAGELLGQEAVVRLVGVEGAHHPVAVRPHLAVVVQVQAVGVAVAGGVQPEAGLVLAVARRPQQPVHQLLVGLRRRVRQEGIDLGRRRRQAGQVEAQPAGEGAPVGLGRRLQALALQARPDEVIDRRRPRRRFRSPRRHQRPVLLPLRPFADPFPDPADFRFGKLVSGIGGRHAQRRVGGEGGVDVLGEVDVEVDRQVIAGRPEVEVERQIARHRVQRARLARRRPGEDHPLIVVSAGVLGERLRADGVETILATIITDDVGAMCRRLRTLAALRQADPLVESVVFGFHIEGPFLSPEMGFRGAHPPEVMCDPTPVHLQELRARRYTQLSGGEQRRVLLARALATEAPLLLLDEPTASLDIAHSLAFFETLQRLAQEGRTVVTVLHDPRDAERFCNRAAVLAAGRLLRESLRGAGELWPARALGQGAAHRRVRR